MHRSPRTILLNSIFILILISTAAMSAVPPYMNYQGRLTDDTGSPIDTIANITFTLYTDDGAATQLWTETQLSVVVTDGLFQVFLGLYNPLSPDLFDGATRLIGIKLGDGPENTPLLPIVSVAYAQKAGHADTAAYALAAPSSGGGGGWVDDGADVHLETSGDNVGIGTATPSEKLDVEGNVRVDGTLNIGDKFLFNPSLSKITSSNDFFNFDSATIQTHGYMTVGGNRHQHKQLTVKANGVFDTAAILALNPTGTAASFVSGTSGSGTHNDLAAINVTGAGILRGGSFLTLDDGHALYARSNGAGNAVHGWAYGTGYSGYFEDGLGVKVDGDLEATGSFKLPIGAAAGRVLTSDASGVASWQASSGGSSPWTLGGGDVYLPDTMLQVAVGLTAPYPRRKLSVLTTGMRDTMALWVNNTTGIAAGFYSNVGTGAAAVSGTKCAIYARAGGGNAAAIFNTIDDGYGVVISNTGTKDALRSQTNGTAYSGRFIGGLGVKVDGNLTVDDTTRTNTLHIGSPTSNGRLSLFADGVTPPLITGTSTSNGGWLTVFNTAGNMVVGAMAGAPDGSGKIEARKASGAIAFDVIADYAGANEPRMRVVGTQRRATFDMRFTDNQSVQLPDSSISSDEMFNEPGVAATFVPGYTYLNDSGLVNIATVTLTIPSDGYVHVEGRTTAAFYGSTTMRRAHFYIDTTLVGSPHGDLKRVMVGCDEFPTNGEYYQSTYITDMLFLPAGTHTFALRGGRTFFVEGFADAFGSSLIAKFYPTSYGSVITTVAASTTADFEKSELVSTENRRTGEVEQYHQVDLRELELRAARACAEAEKAERELLDAQIREQRALMQEEAGR